MVSRICSRVFSTLMQTGNQTVSRVKYSGTIIDEAPIIILLGDKTDLSTGMNVPRGEDRLGTVANVSKTPNLAIYSA